MNELVPVTLRDIGGAMVLTADGRELHAYLGVDTEFKDWMSRRIAEYKFKDGKDFRSFLSESTGGRPPKEYTLTLKMAKELAMVESTPRGKEAREYFMDCEEQALAAARGVPVPRAEASQSGLPEFRRARALDLATKTAERIAAQFPSLSENSRRTLFAKVINPVAGSEVLALPHVEEKHHQAGEVGEMLGITGTMVGRIANQHNLKTPEHGEYRMDKSQHSVKQVEAFVYNQAGVEAVRLHMHAGKPSPAKAAAPAPAPEPQGALL